ncbi:hypothetical protein IEQ34_002606 [Dendrobium chrysotoxum]|uniref:Uncharacterized protein n=1 Tax=Dendrobium chrysotoxum TaxID=161865 RepID=A0AAV7HJ55_DENCH|nr:hypothetical protein IEQ34_002606 [Dendrobium chrysotoxum]
MPLSRLDPRANLNACKGIIFKLRFSLLKFTADRKIAYTRFHKRGWMGPRCGAYNEADMLKTIDLIWRHLRHLKAKIMSKKP